MIVAGAAVVELQESAHVGVAEPALLERIAAEPALVQLVVVVVVAATIVGMWLRAARRIRGSAGRRQLRDYLLGVEQYLSGDADGALRRLDAVVEADPGHLEARLFRALALTAAGRAQEAHREHARLERSDEAGWAWNLSGLAQALFEADLDRSPDGAAVPPRLGDGRAMGPALPVSGAGSLLPAGSALALPLTGLASAVHCADEIESNRAHVLRVVERVAGGESGARAECALLGMRAVPVLLERLVTPSSGASDAFLAVLGDLGAEPFEAVVEAWRAVPGDSAARISVLARYGVRLGAAGLPKFRALLAGADREVRKVVLDVHFALVDLDALDEVLEVCAPVEVLQRLNQIDHRTLVGVLSALPAGHVLLAVHLLDAAFAREDALLDAAALAVDPRPLEDVLVGRSASSAEAARAAISRLGRAETAPSARRVLARLGAGVRELLIAAYADLDQPAEVRSEVRRCLLHAGPGTVPQLCDAFGSAPAPTDADLLELLVDLGADAVPMLVDAYRAGGWLERLARPLRRRRTHRRDSIVRILRRIGGARAVAALQDLRGRETDHDLALRIAQALHALAGTPEAGGASGNSPRGDSIAGA